MAKTLKDHVSDPGAWIRLVYIFLFAVIFNLALPVIAFVVAVQFLFRLLSGVGERTPLRLRRTAGGLRPADCGVPHLPRRGQALSLRFLARGAEGG